MCQVRFPSGGTSINVTPINYWFVHWISLWVRVECLIQRFLHIECDGFILFQMESSKRNVSPFENVTICHGMTTDLYFHILKWVRKLYADHNKENEKYVFLLNVLCIYVCVYVHVNTITPLHIHERSCTLQQTCTHTKLQIREKKENKTKHTFWVHSGIVWQHNNNNPSQTIPAQKGAVFVF